MTGYDNLVTGPRMNDDTLARATAVLSQSRVLRSHILYVRARDGQIVLRGNVSLFYHKQLAQELIRAEIPDATIINEIQVVFKE